MSMSASAKQMAKDEILKLLSDADIGKVSMAETKKSLRASEQYIDLDNLDAGVQMAGAEGVAHAADIIPRSAVDPKTWEKILAKLEA